MMTPKQCHGCGKTIYLGAAHYDVRISIVSGFDGYLPESEENDEGGDERMRQLSRSLEDMSAEQAENQVCQDIDMTLCPDCRKRFLQDLSEYVGETDAPKTKKEPFLLQ